MSKPPLVFAGDTDSDSIRLNSGSSMQDGVVTITKRLYFRVPTGANPREYSDLDVYGHTNFPQKYSAMPEDARYKFYGNASVSHDLDNGHYFTAELEYTTKDPYATDQDGNSVTSDTPPWNLRPDSVEFSYPETRVRFEASYNSTGRLYKEAGYDKNGNPKFEAVLPVVNSAGDPFKLERTVNDVQISFSFAAKSWNINNALTYGNSINSNAIRVCGISIPAGSALLLPPECTYITVYKDNSTSIKWQYWSVRVVIKIDTSGELLLRKVLNVGDRAVFDAAAYEDDLIPSSYGNGREWLPASTEPAPICRFRKYKKHAHSEGGKTSYTFLQTGDNVYCSWLQFIAVRQAAIAWSGWYARNKKDSGYADGILDMQCEQMTQIPLIASGDKAGHVDEDAIKKQKYASLTFRAYPAKNWSSLNLPGSM